MRINSVRLTNFRQHADTYIEFDGGLTGVIGANGTGKSTILEAIAWALYGTAAARGNRDSIKSIRASARATVRVELDFELGGHRYNVIRGLTGAELYLDGGAAPIANTVSGVTDVLRRRLGMSLEEFFNTYFTGQKELSVMAAMGPTERGQFLSKLLGYERLRVAQELARDRKKAIVAEATGVKTGMADPDTVRRAAAAAAELLSSAGSQVTTVEARRLAATTAVSAVSPQWQAVQAERERLQKIDIDRRVAEGERAARQREIERQDRELAELATAQSDLSSLRGAMVPLVGVRSELETMDRLAREDGRRRTLLGNERDLTAEITKLRDRRGQLETAPKLEQENAAELEKRRTELAEIDRAYEAARTEWVRDTQEANTKIEQLKQSLAEYKKQRELLVNEGENGTCPICSRPLGDHYRTVLDAIDEQIETIGINGNYFRDRIEQLAAMPAEVAALEAKKRHAGEGIARLEKKMVKIRAAVQELATADGELADRVTKLESVRAELAQVPAGYSAEQHTTLRRHADDLQMLESRATKLIGALEREGQLRVDRDRVMTALSVVGVRLADLAAERAKMEDVEGRYESTRLAFEVATAQLRVADVEAASALARHGAAVAACEVATRAVVEVERSIARLDELTKERRLHEELDRAYSDLRTDLNLQLRPDISERASELLAELSDGRYSELELDESYDIIVLEDGLPKTVISGGEEDLANLVLRLAISQMIAERAGQPVSLLILDEIFGSLDVVRRINVLRLLSRLGDRFEQIIFVTHIDLELEGPGQRIGVRYDEESGSSRVEVRAPEAFIEPDQLEIGAA